MRMPATANPTKNEITDLGLRSSRSNSASSCSPCLISSSLMRNFQNLVSVDVVSRYQRKGPEISEKHPHPKSGNCDRNHNVEPRHGQARREIRFNQPEKIDKSHDDDPGR